MTDLAVSTPASSALSPVTRPQAVRPGLFVRLMSWWEARQAAGRLTQMDDRLLRDIGLDRSEIDFAVRHGRKPRG